jgi:hypothetical protein
MKKCKSCKSDIDVKATKCPHCQADQRGWFRRHPILTGLLVLFVIGIIGLAGSGGKNGSTNQPTTQTTNTETKPAEPMKTTAREIADAFDANQVAAEKEWSGKYVEFSSIVTNITDSGLSFTNVASKEFSMAQISCRVKDKNRLLSLKNGQNVTVRGVVGSQTIGVIDVDDCEVVK